MKKDWRLAMMRSVQAILALLMMGGAAIGAVAQTTTVSQRQMADNIRHALERLPYYGVFDFLAFHYDKGVVTLYGFAHRATLPDEAVAAVRRVRGVDEVASKIEKLPVNQNDDRIRWATFYNIYTDEFLSRYAPGGGLALRYDRLFDVRRFPGSQPVGAYPIHIIVKGGRTTLVGMVDNDADKNIAGLRAREVTGVFGVENELEVQNQKKKGN
jgi:osmotically-inducible protein OsmY